MAEHGKCGRAKSLNRLFRSHVSMWSLGSFIAAIIGLVVIAFGFIVVIVQKDNAGWYMSLAGGIEDAVAILFFANINRFINPISEDHIKRVQTKRDLLLIQFVQTADAENRKKYEAVVIEHLLTNPTLEPLQTKPNSPRQGSNKTPHSRLRTIKLQQSEQRTETESQLTAKPVEKHEQ